MCECDFDVEKLENCVQLSKSDGQNLQNHDPKLSFEYIVIMSHPQGFEVQDCAVHNIPSGPEKGVGRILFFWQNFGENGLKKNENCNDEDRC